MQKKGEPLWTELVNIHLRYVSKTLQLENILR